MAKGIRLPITMTDREKLLGFGYALVDLFLLPSLLAGMNDLLAQPLSMAWINFLYFALNFLFLSAIFHRFLKRSIAYGGKNITQLFGAGFLGFVGYWVANFILSFCILRLFPDYANPNDGSIAEMTGGNFPMMAIGTVLFVPMAEELIHRGLVFGLLLPKSKTAAYVISAAVFAAVHVVGYLGSAQELTLVLAFIQYLPAGLVLGWAYEKSGTIFAPMMIHTVINAMGIWAMR